MPVSRKNKKILILNLILKFTCFVALSINYIHLTTKYLNYCVIIKVAPYIPIENSLPKFSLCFALSPLIQSRPNASFFYPFKYIINETVGSLNRKTPSIETAMDGCSYRDWNLDIMLMDRPLNDCKKYFKMSKYRMHIYMCYKFEPPTLNYTLYSLLNTANYHRLLYQVFIGSPLNDGYKFTPLVHFSEYPFYNQLFDQLITNKIGQNTSLTLKFRSYRLNRLPPPYETRCQVKSEPECFTRCLSRHYEKYGIVRIFTQPGPENDSLIIPDFKAKYNGLNETEIRELYMRTCHDFCGYGKKCHLDMSITSVTSSVKSKSKLIIKVETISHPSILMEVVAKYDFNNFFTQLTSLAACWICFSVLGTIDSFIYSKIFMKITGKHWFKLFRLSYNCQIRVMKFKRKFISNNNLVTEVKVSSKEQNINSLTKVLSIIFKVCLLIGFIIQVTNVLVAFFKYETTTRIIIEFNPIVPIPKLDICWDFQFLFNVSFDSFNHNNYKELLTQLDKVSNFSLSTLVSKAYKIDEVIDGCRIRSYIPNTEWNLLLKPKNECLMLFNISRYFMSNKICYHIARDLDRGFNQLNTKWHLHVPGIFYTIIFTDIIAHMGELRYILSHESPPDVSMELSQADHPTFVNKLLVLTSNVNEQHLMPHPYDSMCNPYMKKPNCLGRCITDKGISKLNLLPYNQAFTGKFMAKYPNARILTYSHLLNKTVNVMWHKIEDECQSFCAKNIFCHKKTIKTLISQKSRSKHILEVAIGARAFPDSIAHTIPLTTMFDLYLNIICCANFWLGFSIISVNPGNFWSLKNITKFSSNTSNRLAKSAVSFLAPVNSFYNQEQGSKITQTQFVLKRSIRFTILTLCTVCCFTHLYLTLVEFLQYRTIMNTYSLPEEKTHRYGMSICISLNELFEKENLARFTMDQFIEKSPNITKSIIGCGYRGPGPGVSDEESKKDSSNRIFFIIRNQSHCENVFKVKKFLNNEFICYLIVENIDSNIKSASEVKFYDSFNEFKGMFTLGINSTFLTDYYKVVISPLSLKSKLMYRQFYPKDSIIWAPLIEKSFTPSWFSMSYIRHDLQALPSPYMKDGFWDHIFLSCLDHCMKEYLKPYGKTLFGMALGGPTKYLTSTERKSSLVKNQITNFISNCKESCMIHSDSHFESETSFTITSITQSFNWGYEKETSEFYVRRTEHTVIKVVYLPYWSLFELFISIGSILGIWFGFSAIQLQSLFQLNNFMKNSNHFTIGSRKVI